MPAADEDATGHSTATVGDRPEYWLKARARRGLVERRLPIGPCEPPLSDDMVVDGACITFGMLQATRRGPWISTAMG